MDDQNPMKLMIHRDGQEYGPYTLEQVKELLANGTLAENDLAWVEGGSDWVPLRDAILRSQNTSIAPTPSTVAPVVPDEKAPELNRFVGGCVMAGGLLIFLSIVIIALAPSWMGKLIKSTYTVGPVSVSPIVESNYAYISSDINGDLISADMKTDYADKKLRNEVLEHIYSMAKDNPSATKLKLTLHVTGMLLQKNATLEIDDLATVRLFSDKKAYAVSDARSVIDGELTAAGL